MALPEYLERLNEISIDTLGLSESTQALLKWYGITHVLDCVAFFYKTALNSDARNLSSRLFRVMFAEVKPVMVTAGYWGLLLDAEVWQVFREQKYEPPQRRIVHWQCWGIDLYQTKMPLELLALSEMPPEFTQRFASIGDCIDELLILLRANSEFWLEIEMYHDYDRATQPPCTFNELVFGVVQPRLVELGYWVFVEVHVDDFDEDAGEIEWGEIEWEDDDGDDEE